MLRTTVRAAAVPEARVTPDQATRNSGSQRWEKKKSRKANPRIFAVSSVGQEPSLAAQRSAAGAERSEYRSSIAHAH